MAQRDGEADGWERSEFPIVCQSCLGDNPYLQMTVANYDKQCKICTRPFTVFRWRPGRNARYKKTEICETCCKLKNVCQVCLLDLEFGLPVQVRDTALNVTTHDSIPRSDVNREYFAEEHDRMTRAGLDYESSFGKMRPNDTLLKLQRRAPCYERNQPRVCTHYTIGRCTRGAECPYRHEMPKTGELSHQNIKDRYYGILEQDIRDQLYAYGEIESIRILAEKACAFVTYTTRDGAEKATQELYNSLVINGQRLKLSWARPQVPKPNQDGWNQQGSVAPPTEQHYSIRPPPHNQHKSSMVPRRMGAIPSEENNGPSSSSSYLMPPPPYGHVPSAYQQQYHHYPGPSNTKSV